MLSRLCASSLATALRRTTEGSVRLSHLTQWWHHDRSVTITSF